MIRPEVARLDNRSRGNAAQQLERYKSLARDATQSGDRITAEYYLQYADHYFRVLNENRPRYEDQRPQQQGSWQDQGGYRDNDAERDYARDDERQSGDQQSYADRNVGQRDDMGYDRDDRQGQGSVQDDRQHLQRDDRARNSDPRENDNRNNSNRNNGSRNTGSADADSRDNGGRDDRPRDARAQTDRPRDDRNNNLQRDRPREDRQAREPYARRDRSSPQGGAEPVDPPVPVRQPVVQRQPADDAGIEAAASTAPRRGRPRRTEPAGDDPFAVRRAPAPAPATATATAPEPEVVEAAASVEAPESLRAEPGAEQAAPLRRRRARKADPDKDAELSLENV